MSFDLPDWLNNQLRFDPSYEIQKGHVAEAMYHGDRPYYSIAHVERELDHMKGRDTIRERLNEMVEINAMKKEPIGTGEVWWINYPETDWPKPPDVEVAPIPDEPTVAEFLSRPHTFIATVCIVVAAASGIILWIGDFHDGARGSAGFFDHEPI